MAHRKQFDMFKDTFVLRTYSHINSIIAISTRERERHCDTSVKEHKTFLNGAFFNICADGS